MSKAKDQKVLPLSSTLRDLALLRASNIDLATLIPSELANDAQQSEENKEFQESLKNSYDYARLARTVMKINNGRDVDVQGQRIESIREELSSVEEGLMDG